MNKKVLKRLAKANARRKKREAKFRERENCIRPSELASLRPDKDIPWCTGCRAHTRHKTVMEWKWVMRGGYSGKRRKPEQVQEPRDRCRRCNAYVSTPAQSRAAENMLWFVLPLMLLFFGPLCILTFASLAGFTVHINETVGLVWLLILLLTALVLGRFAWFGQLSLSYRRWSQWAKEQKANNPS